MDWKEFNSEIPTQTSDRELNTNSKYFSRIISEGGSVGTFLEYVPKCASLLPKTL